MEETAVFSWQTVDTDVAESVYLGTEMLFVFGLTLHVVREWCDVYLRPVGFC
jgi:hypothetical protein